jgi:hypothetical protein
MHRYIIHIIYQQMTDLKHGNNKLEKFIPPDIAGHWLLTNTFVITDDNLNTEPTLDDIIKRPDNGVRIKQKREFITYKYMQTTEFIPVLRNRLGIWKPTLVNGVPITWEVLLADWDDTALGFIQVLETDDCGKPIKLLFDQVESFTSPTDTTQASTVVRGILIRKHMKKSII